AKALLHLCAHVIGIHLFIMSEVRSRSTFLKVGQAIMHGKDLEVEKALKERMIHSVMPRRVADDLLRKTSIPRGQIIFRPFNMKRMEPVSILFADIVGFTKMSANKSAPALVGLLNDLFGRFDRLCELTGCEKISTLGDCYYCVAGCPEPSADHAYCCVEMGLGMIQAIEQFCQETRETVSMRVGVHTGTVLCGILGMKRFKFDVWSNDVNLANLMEQLGVAGKVHLSEATAQFLGGPIPEGRRAGVGESGAERSGETQGSLGASTDLKSESSLYGHSSRISSSLMENLFIIWQNPRANQRNDSKSSEGFRRQGQVGNGTESRWERQGLGPKVFKDLETGNRSDAAQMNRCRRPPINKISLNFLERPLEKAYHSSYKDSTFSSFLDVLLSCFVFVALTMACFLPPLVSPAPVSPPATAAVTLAVLAGLLELASVVLSVRMAFCLEEVTNCTLSLLLVVSGWIPRHVIGAVLISLPSISVLSHLSCSVHPLQVCLLNAVNEPCWCVRIRSGSITICLSLFLQVTMFLCCATILAIIQYCNFCQLSFWMRSVLATATGVILLLVLYSPLHSIITESFLVMNTLSSGGSPSVPPGPDPPPEPLDVLIPEAVLAFFLLLLLVWFLNREFEVSYRLHYHGNVEADKHRFKIQTMRDQAEWLLGNIIPIHVAEQLKVSIVMLTQSYSKNHDSVGVIFASIVNFSEFYEETYEGGKECYRVLNELIGDFDELLRKDEFKSVEKIKTIGATYMAASGLNVQQLAENDSDSPHAHLRALFNFALEMMGVLEDFNKNMLGFGFKLRIGFNHGPLTAGVIGTTKLLYDIWGDTVNIASRMDSTGVECRVQVSEESHAVLSAMGLEFDYRGTVNVKGKGQMRTYLYPKSGES
uniref:Adenylate cyclase type 9 n=1 Tax=Tetraodon nigroviridis TaxID=99883 RepID=H3D9B4_TETNG